MWTLKAAIELIRAIQPKARKCGYHLALGGGVLNKGSSTKDLDLIAVIDDQKKQDHTKLFEIFEKLGYILKDHEHFPSGIMCSDYRHRDGKKIDLLLMPDVRDRDGF